MRAYVLRRFLHSLFVLIGISALVFFALHLSGDPLALMLAEANPTPEEMAELRRLMGLDKPIWVQYWLFLKRAVTGDFGQSWYFRSPALPLVLERMPATFQLAFSGLAVAVCVALPVGIFSALRRNTLFDLLARLLALIGVSFPNFWMGLVLILLFSLKLGMLPASGKGTLAHLVMPALTVGTGLAATLMRLLRSSMLEVLTQDYVKTARAKGLAEKVVIARHALRNALIPVITLLGLQLGHLLGGTVIVETVFSWPGVGRLAVQAIGWRDFAVVQAAVVQLAFFMVLINFLVDMVYLVLDPRIKLS